MSAISALGAHEVRGEWLEPVEGTEPIEYETGGQVTIDGMVYKIDMKSTDDEENEKGGRIEGMVVFPTEMMSVFGDNDESIGEMIEKFGERYKIFMQKTGRFLPKF